MIDFVLRDRTAANSVSAYLSVLTKAGVGLALGVFLARFFGAEDFGVYRSVLALVAVGGVVAKLGLDEALVRYGSEFLAKGLEKTYRRTLVVFALFRIVASVCLCGLLWLAWLAVAGNIGALDVPIMALVGALTMIVASGLSQLLGASNFTARSENYVSDIAEAVRELLVLAGVTAGVLILTWGISEVLWFRSATLAILTGYFIYRTWTNQLGCRTEERNKGYKSRILRYAAWSYGATLAFGVPVIQFQQLVVAHQLGAEGAGVFGVGALLIGFVVMLNPARVLRKVVEPKLVGRYLMRAEVGVLHESFSLLTRIALIVSIPFAVAMFAFGDLLIGVAFGQEYMQGAFVVALLAAGQVAFSACAAYAPIVSVLERKEVVAFAGLFSLLNIILSIAFIEWFGLEGIGVASVLTGLCLWIYYYAVVSYLVGGLLRIEWRLLSKVLVNSVPLFLVPVGNALFELSLWQGLGIAGIASALCGIFMIVNCPLRSDEWIKVRTFIDNGFGRDARLASGR